MIAFFNHEVYVDSNIIINNNYFVNNQLGSVVSSEYDPVGKFRLTPEDIEVLSKELRDTLIPFHQVKITGDLGEGI